MATTTRGFGFAGPAARGLAGLNPAILQFVNGASLVPDSGLEGYYNGAAQGLKSLTSGVLGAADSIAGGIKERTALNAREKELAANREAQARKDALEQQRYDQQMGLENLKLKRMEAGDVRDIEKDTLNNELLRLQIEREKDPLGTFKGLISGTDPALPVADAAPVGASTPNLQSVPEELINDPDSLPIRNLTADQIFNSTPAVDKSLVPNAPINFDLSAGAPEIPLAPLSGFRASNLNVPAPSAPVPNVETKAPIAGPSLNLPVFNIPNMPGKLAYLDPISRKLVISDAPAPVESTAIPEGMRPKNVSVNSKGEKTTTYESASEKGGEKLLQDQMKTITNITEAEKTLNNIEEKLGTISETVRGPITGRIRGSNPYDTEAQAVENMVNSLVPGLARGVFGEVGVLTDQDVARYKAMIPNIRTDPTLAKQIIADLKGKLASARESNLSTWESSGYDVRELRKKYPGQVTTTIPSSLPIVSSEADLKALPAGTQYTAPNGKTYRKP